MERESKGLESEYQRRENQPRKAEPGYAMQNPELFDKHQSYTYAQAARFLGVSVRTVMREVKAQRLLVHKVRGCTRIRGTDFLAYTQEGRL